MRRATLTLNKTNTSGLVTVLQIHDEVGADIQPMHDGYSLIYINEENLSKLLYHLYMSGWHLQELKRLLQEAGETHFGW